jgi:predicted secreted acid phosphatase
MTDNEWPLEADFTDIRPMTPEERKASLDRNEKNMWRKCVSCGNASRGTWCGFCQEEE